MRVLFLCLMLATVPGHALEGRDLMSGQTQKIEPGSKGLVAVFLSNECPCSNSHVPLLKKLAAEFKDFRFVGIHANANEPVKEAKVYFAKAGLPFPVLQDEGSKLANEYKASRTPHAFLFRPDGKLAYKGGVTDSTEAENAKAQPLRNALLAVSKGEDVKVSETRSLGCAIQR